MLCAGKLQSQDMQVHPDSQCAESQGGAMCALRVAPAGLAYMASSPLTIFTEVVDVRSAAIIGAIVISPSLHIPV